MEEATKKRKLTLKAPQRGIFGSYSNLGREDFVGVFDGHTTSSTFNHRNNLIKVLKLLDVGISEVKRVGNTTSSDEVSVMHDPFPTKKTFNKQARRLVDQMLFTGSVKVFHDGSLDDTRTSFTLSLG